MGLSNQQIERYTRQIIVPGFGGTGQERLLTARLMLAGRAADIASVLSYMAGAGVGEIRLRLPSNDAAALDSFIARAAQLNPDVAVKPAESVTGVNLVLAIGADCECSEIVPGQIGPGVPVIFARLDEPASIAMIPSAPPCLACGDADLLRPFGPRTTNAGFLTMIAASEALKILAGTATTSAPSLLLFNGFACTRRELRQDPFRAECGCS
jgi:molybdopterin-synthase adenylyltransferase